MSSRTNTGGLGPKSSESQRHAQLQHRDHARQLVWKGDGTANLWTWARRPTAEQHDRKHLQTTVTR